MGLKWCAHHTGPAPTHQVPRCPPKFLNGISQYRREHVLLLSPADSTGCDIPGAILLQSHLEVDQL